MQKVLDVSMASARYVVIMPRQARLDAPGALHHVMGREIERKNIFRSAADHVQSGHGCRITFWSPKAGSHGTSTRVVLVSSQGTRVFRG